MMVGVVRSVCGRKNFSLFRGFFLEKFSLEQIYKKSFKKLFPPSSLPFVELLLLLLLGLSDCSFYLLLKISDMCAAFSFLLVLNFKLFLNPGERIREGKSFTVSESIWKLI